MFKDLLSNIVILLNQPGGGVHPVKQKIVLNKTDPLYKLKEIYIQYNQKKYALKKQKIMNVCIIKE